MRTDELLLVQQALENDAEAFAEIVERYKDAMYRYCFSFVHDEDIAEDLAQDTFIKAYFRLSTYDQSKKLSTWLFKIATNTTYDHLRRAKRTNQLGEEAANRIISRADSPARLAEYDELHRAVDRLDIRYRTVISLYYWQGASYAEIAEIMGKPEGTVKGWLSRAKQQLRKEMS